MDDVKQLQDSLEKLERHTHHLGMAVEGFAKVHHYALQLPRSLRDDGLLTEEQADELHDKIDSTYEGIGHVLDFEGITGDLYIWVNGRARSVFCRTLWIRSVLWIWWSIRMLWRCACLVCRRAPSAVCGAPASCSPVVSTGGWSMP